MSETNPVTADNVVSITSARSYQTGFSESSRIEETQGLSHPQTGDALQNLSGLTVATASGSISGDTLSAATLRKINPDSNFSRFLDVISLAIGQLESCIQYLKQEERFNADDAFMASKPILAELLMHRGLNDSVGLIATTCFLAVSRPVVVTDCPSLPATMVAALTRLYRTPFMDFAESARLSSSIEAETQSLSVPGYDDVALELIGNVLESESAE